MNLVKLTIFVWLSVALNTLRKAWAKDDMDPPSGERETLPAPQPVARERLTRERQDTLKSAEHQWPTVHKTRHPWEMN